MDGATHNVHKSSVVCLEIVGSQIPKDMKLPAIKEKNVTQQPHARRSERWLRRGLGPKISSGRLWRACKGRSSKMTTTPSSTRHTHPADARARKRERHPRTASVRSNDMDIGPGGKCGAACCVLGQASKSKSPKAPEKSKNSGPAPPCPEFFGV